MNKKIIWIIVIIIILALAFFMLKNPSTDLTEDKNSQTSSVDNTLSGQDRSLDTDDAVFDEIEETINLLE